MSFAFANLAVSRRWTEVLCDESSSRDRSGAFGGCGPDTETLVLSPDGDVIIRRQPSADFPDVAYYVVDRRGRLLGVLEMKNNERIIGAGARSLYVLETDADDLKYIRRHPWPSPKLPG